GSRLPRRVPLPNKTETPLPPAHPARPDGADHETECSGESRPGTAVRCDNCNAAVVWLPGPDRANAVYETRRITSPHHLTTAKPCALVNLGGTAVIQNVIRTVRRILSRPFGRLITSYTGQTAHRSGTATPAFDHYG